MAQETVFVVVVDGRGAGLGVTPLMNDKEEKPEALQFDTQEKAEEYVEKHILGRHCSYCILMVEPYWELVKMAYV